MPGETDKADAVMLRRRAEIRATEDRDPGLLSPGETWRLVHELQVHQIELEMQNEELRQTQVELERSRQCYLDLYTQAPVSYITITEQGYIHEANLKAAALLGVEPERLAGRPLGNFFVSSDFHEVYRCHRRLLRTGEPQACDARLASRVFGVAVIWLHLELAMARGAPTG